jgi:hypothetical protein
MLEDLEFAICEFWRALDTDEETEATQSKRMQSMEAIVPHADLSGIIFHGAKDRTPRETAIEALLREELWKSGGRPLVRERIRALMLEALENPNSTLAQTLSAKAVLKSLNREEQEDIEKQGSGA